MDRLNIYQDDDKPTTLEIHTTGSFSKRNIKHLASKFNPHRLKNLFHKKDQSNGAVGHLDQTNLDLLSPSDDEQPHHQQNRHTPTSNGSSEDLSDAASSCSSMTSWDVLPEFEVEPNDDDDDHYHDDIDNDDSHNHDLHDGLNAANNNSCPKTDVPQVDQIWLDDSDVNTENWDTFKAAAIPTTEFLLSCIQQSHADRNANRAVMTLLTCDKFVHNMEAFGCFKTPFRSELRKHLVALGNTMKERYFELKLFDSLGCTEINKLTKYHKLVSEHHPTTNTNTNTGSSLHCGCGRGNLNRPRPTISSPPWKLTQLVVLPPIPASFGFMYAERTHLQALLHVAIATDHMFQEAVRHVVVAVGLDVSTNFRASKPKSYAHMIDKVYDPHHHRNLAKPRGVHNTDILRSMVIAKTVEQFKRFYKALLERFAGAGECENLFVLHEPNHADRFHINSVNITVIFQPKKKLSYTKLCHSQAIQTLWAEHRGRVQGSGEPPGRWKLLCDQARAYLESDTLAKRRVVVLGEVQIMLEDDVRVYDAMLPSLTAYRASAVTPERMCEEYKRLLLQPNRRNTGSSPKKPNKQNRAKKPKQPKQPKQSKQPKQFKHQPKQPSPPPPSPPPPTHHQQQQQQQQQQLSPPPPPPPMPHTLIEACAGGHMMHVMRFLQNEADINQRDCNHNGNTPLLCAAENGFDDVVSFLLDLNASVDHANNDGVTALMVAADHGHATVASELLRWSANPNQCASNGATPLGVAAMNGHADALFVLLTHGACVDLPTQQASVPLLLAARNGHFEVVSCLLSFHAVVKVTDDNGHTPLALAARGGYRDVVMLLLHHKAVVNTQCDEGHTPLFEASHSGHADLVSLLLNRNADVNLPSKSGITPLDAASSQGHLDVVKVLVEQGHAEINTSTSFTSSPHTGKTLAQREIAEYLEIIATRTPPSDR